MQTRSVCKHGRLRQAKQCKGSQDRLDIPKEAMTGKIFQRKPRQARYSKGGHDRFDIPKKAKTG
jgi:hypothetical protein